MEEQISWIHFIFQKFFLIKLFVSYSTFFTETFIYLVSVRKNFWDRPDFFLHLHGYYALLLIAQEYTIYNNLLCAIPNIYV